MKLPKKKYKLIYADPPWDYSDVHTWRKMGGGVRGKYKTMKLEDIKKLPIGSFSDEDCLLFLWVTFPNLKEGLEVIKAWGFKYVTIGFTWVKLNSKNGKPFFGIGYYTKSNAELCLIGVKGKPSRLKKTDKVSSVIISRKREHSRKPDEARQRILQLVGDIPKVELFARERHKGWDYWGNEVPSDVQTTIKEKCV